MPDSPQGEMDPASLPIDDIGWLAETLFTVPNNMITPAPPWSSNAGVAAWTALPFRGTPRRLVPTSARFAAEAFGNTHDAMSRARRSLGAATRIAVRGGPLRLARRLHADEAIVFGDPSASVIAAAAKGLGETVASCAITLGPRRYNRKPVVQLMNSQAETIGFLKVGADAVTSAMVATEADALEQLHEPTAPPLLVPRVLWRSQWHGRHVACFSPVSVDNANLIPADYGRLVETARSVVAAGDDVEIIDLQNSAVIEQLRSYTTSGPNEDVAQLLDRALQVFGGRQVSTGQWHGDFSPWNMISTAETTALIDWEFASKAMVVGADLMHHRVMVATHLDGVAINEPLSALLELGDDVTELNDMGVSPEQHRPHLLLYLFELIRRDLELHQAGRADTGFGPAARTTVRAILDQADR